MSARTTKIPSLPFAFDDATELDNYLDALEWRKTSGYDQRQRLWTVGDLTWPGLRYANGMQLLRRALAVSSLLAPLPLAVLVAKSMWIAVICIGLLWFLPAGLFALWHWRIPTANWVLDYEGGQTTLSNEQAPDAYIGADSLALDVVSTEMGHYAACISSPQQSPDQGLQCLGLFADDALAQRYVDRLGALILAKVESHSGKGAPSRPPTSERR